MQSHKTISHQSPNLRANPLFDIEPPPNLNDVPDTVPTKRMLSWAKNSTLYRLQRQIMSEQQLATAIKRKAQKKFEGITPEQVQALADAAVKIGYDLKALDDEVFAGITTRNAVRNGKSRRMIAHKLSIKGVASETAAVALDEADDLYAAVVFARKRAFGPFRRVDLDEKRHGKEMSSFARSGFSFDIGKKVFAMSFEDAEEVLANGP